MSKCVICQKPATTTYQDENSCGSMVCEYTIQEAIDHQEDVG
jgi:hypothetical protein